MNPFNRRRALELALHIEEIAPHTPTDNDTRSVAIAVMLPADEITTPAVSIVMDGAELRGAKAARVACTDVLVAHISTDDPAEAPYARWGGIRVYDSGGALVCVLGVSGRSAKGNRILAVTAAHDFGYMTDFGQDGLTDGERRTVPPSQP